MSVRAVLLTWLAGGACVLHAPSAIRASDVNTSNASPESPQLRISPPVLLEGDPVSIRILGLKPKSLATLHARSVGSSGDRTVAFYGAATFIANADGIVDLASDAPVRGYYQGVDLRGLFWSQKRLDQDPEGQAAIKTLQQGPAPVDPGTVDISLEQDGASRDRETLSLMTSDPAVIREDVRAERLVARYFHRRGVERAPTVVVLGGAEGGLSFADLIGPPLAARGYAVLGVAYFAPASNAMAGLPTALNRIPVETLERARDWLRGRPEADVRRFGVIGASKGGEFALVLASIYDWIGAVVAFVPSDTVWCCEPSGIRA